METVKIKSTIPVFDSENGVLHLVMIAIIFLLMNLGVDEAAAAAIATGLVGSIGEIRGLIKKGLAFVWSWNSLVYLAAILTFLLPALAEYWEFLPEMGKAIAEQNWAKVGTLTLALVNLIYQAIKGKNKEIGSQDREPIVE